MNAREQYLTEQIIKASQEYYTTGKSFLSDKEFDVLVEELESINPNSEVLKVREFHSENDWNYQLEKLPNKLYSIKKVKTWKEIQNWIDFVCKKANISEIDRNNINLILTPKYDGIKILYYKGSFYTRYETGEQGYNVSKRIWETIHHSKDFLSLEGELIISKSNFAKYCTGYTSSRNFIPAIFSSKEKLNAQDKVTYIRYSIYGEDGRDISKEEQLKYCNEINDIKVPYLKIPYKDLSEQVIIDFYFNNISDYEYDGVVIDVDSVAIRNLLGETQKYLDCCRAYKGDSLFDDIKESKIEGINWQMSRYGKLTPVAKITPVLINEGIVTNVSLYNAAYIYDNNIFVGQKIKVTRKGKINPKIVEFLNRAEYKVVPDMCPFCGEDLHWDDSHIQLFCKNSNCKELITQKVYNFFKILGVQNFGLESVRAYINKGLNFEDFFNSDKILNTQIEGIGIISKKSFIEELRKIKEKGVELEKIQEATGCFLGLGASTLKELNKLNLDLEYLYKDSYYNEKFKESLKLNGIGALSAEVYFGGIYDFYKFYENIKEFIPIKEEKIFDNTNSKFQTLNIVFTGFRNEEWKNKIEAQGGKVLSNVSSTCNLLVVKDINSVSSKTQKAKELNIKIISVEDFKEMIG